MINWTEEDVEFVVKNIIMPCFESYINQDLKFKDMYHDSYERLFNTLADRIRDLNYEAAKNKSFFLEFLRHTNGFSHEYIMDVYDTYCKEYDKLNKHLLEDKKDVGENE